MTDISLSNIFEKNANPFGFILDLLKNAFGERAFQQGNFFSSILGFFGLSPDTADTANAAPRRASASYSTAHEIEVASGSPVGNLLSLIRKHEASGSYDAVYKSQDIIVDGRAIPPTEATVGQVLAAQQQWRSAGAESTAVGGYQFIHKTLDGLVKEMNIPLDARFDEALQDQLATRLLERRGLSDFQNGSISTSRFMKNLSAEWAALPKDMGGKSYYEGQNGNKALVEPEQVVATLHHIAKEEQTSPAQVASLSRPSMGGPG